MRNVMGIDQAFDRTGVALYLPGPIDLSKVSYLIENFVSKYDPRFQKRAPEMISLIKSMSKKGGPLEVPPLGKKRLPSGFGAVVRRGKKMGICVHFTIPFPPSDEPEWRQARSIARKLSRLASWFIHSFEDGSAESALIAIEGMAVGGARSSIAILPCLGLLYGSIWEQLETGEKTKGRVRELPISTWKKHFSGSSRADKKEIKQTCMDMGFGRIEFDDESDAIGLAISLSEDSLNQIGKTTSGRIRPTRSERMSKLERKKKKKKKAKKKQSVTKKVTKKISRRRGTK